MSGDNRGQSELIGVILLTAIAVVLTLTVGSVLFANASSNAAADPLVDISGNATSKYITVEHAGGEQLDTSSVTVILRGDGDEERYALDTFTQIQGDDTSKFEPGDRWRRTHGILGDEIQVLLLDEKSNSIVDRVILDVTITIAARFDTSPRYPREGDTITFDASDSEVAGSTLTSYDWDFGDGRAGSGETVDKSYADDGRYDVNLTVEAADGRTATRTKTVQVYNEAPTASFSYSPSAPEGGQSVSFDASGSSDPDGTVSTYEWDFNDDGVVDATDETASYTYSTSGTYTASLTVTDDDGNARTTTETIAVSDPSPSVTTISVEGAPINYSEAGKSGRNVTIVYDEQMDTGVTPTVSITGVSLASTPSGSRWLNDTAYLRKTSIKQNTEDVTATIEVTGAEDSDGNTQTKATGTFDVDTERPGAVNDIIGIPNINASNRTAVTYDIRNPSTVDGDEDISVTLTDENGTEVVNRTAIQGGDNGITNVTLDATALADGTIDVTAIAVDEVNNTGGVAGPDQLTKDTVAPSVSDYSVRSNADRRLTVTFNATEVTDSITDVSIDIVGPGSVTGRANTNNNNTNGDTTSYEITYKVDQNGQYDVTLRRIVDGLGNNGSTGQTATVTTGANPTITSASVASDNSYVDITFSEGVYTDSDGTGGVIPGDLDLTLTQNSGNVSSARIDDVTTTGGATPSGGGTTLRVNLGLTGQPATGEEDIEITPVNGSSIYDADGLALPDTGTTGTLHLNDNSKPNVTVSTPDGGEQLRGGQNYNITWSASDINTSSSSPTDISYTTDGGNSYSTIVTGTSNDGIYTWTVNNTDNSNVQVRVNVTDNAGNTGSDLSDSTFTIDSTNPTVSVDDPNGGTIEGGSTYIINWSASDSLTGVDTVDIEYSADNGDSYSTVATDEDNDGGYDWNVPTDDTTEALIRVNVTDNVGNEVSDVSDSMFTIDSTAPTIDTFSGITAFKGNNTVLIESLDVSDSLSGLKNIDVVVRDNNGALIGSNNFTESGTQSFSRSDLQVSTSDIQPNKQYSVKVIATDQASNQGSVIKTTSTGGKTANANGEYEVDEGGSVTLDGSGSNPQTGNPDYEWTIVSSAPSGDSISNNDAGTPNATYNAPSNVDSDTEVTLRLTVTEQRTDFTDNTTVTIRNVSANNGGGSSTAGFEGTASASNISKKSGSASQTFDFTPNQSIAAGEMVTINLDGAQGVKSGKNNNGPQPVDYQSASINDASSDLAGGSASISADSNTAEVTYTANSDVSAGTAISIQVDNIATQSGNAGPFDVVFSRSDGSSETTTFTLTN